MKQERLNLYTVNMKYVRNLHNQGDDRVYSVSPQIGKEKRPFVGIVIICDDKEYCIPLSSLKEKHLKMKNDIDFHKILDDKGKIIGVLDINNMIPVRKDLLKRVDISNKPSDLPETKRYKELVSNQLNYCRKNQDIIIKKANKLYKMTKKKNTSKQLKQRCLNWERLESILERFNASNLF